MKKLNRNQQKTISGGGPCGKKLCSNDYIPVGAVFTGTCSSTFGCISAYVVFIICDSSGTHYTFCSTNL
jgi:hypothetical protein